jgi:hypothetical protein
MNPEARPESVAVVCDARGASAGAVDEFLTAAGLVGARRYASRDLDEVERAVLARQVRRVVFARAADVLDGLWSEEIHPAQWLAADVQVDFVDLPADGGRAWLAATCDSWQQWRRAWRRRQIIGGLALSAVAIAAAFVLHWALAR